MLDDRYCLTSSTDRASLEIARLLSLHSHLLDTIKSIVPSLYCRAARALVFLA